MPKDRISKAEKVNEIFKDMKKLDPSSPVRESEASIQAHINSFSSGLKEKAKIYGLIPGTKEKEYEKSIEKAVEKNKLNNERNKLIKGAKKAILRSKHKDAERKYNRSLLKKSLKKKSTPEIKAEAAKKGKMIKLKGGGAAIRGTNFKGIF
jgi:hypothetical protein